MADNHNPDVSHYSVDRHDYPILPVEEWDNWQPIRPIIAEHGYDIAHAFNSGWMVRVSNPSFTGNGNPAVAVIHNSVVPDFHRAMGGEVPEGDPASSIMGYWDAYLEAIGDANEDFSKSVDEAREARNRAYRKANSDMLEALARWEIGAGSE